MSSGRGDIGVQQGGGRGGGGAIGAPAGGGWWSSGYGYGYGGHDAGGSGGGRRPWGVGDGPMGHRWEDPRRDGRVQKTRGRGGRGAGRGAGRGRGSSQGMAKNYQNSWFSDKEYQERDVGRRVEPRRANSDSNINAIGENGGEAVADGSAAVDGRQEDRTMHSPESQYEKFDVESGEFVGLNLTADDAFALIARADLTQRPGTLYDVEIKPISKNGGTSTREGYFVDGSVMPRVARTQPQGTRHDVRIKARAEEGAASNEVIKERFMGALVTPHDPFALDENQDNLVLDPLEVEAAVASAAENLGTEDAFRKRDQPHEKDT
ncbi:hypothetical protein J7T55_005279 [Diaporthe amygdali]|uniref:uncharacterized protein n=1 Tax=Phomopsis amygdali TaxID=1214568 RepID=UPI0022FE0C8B|nr:uncharacterized protein J7T55_005279 [Diaporthe amygdali]KAJ0108302.1 hypothetical protein J7T55_005279 [Diaporthe amygdali]